MLSDLWKCVKKLWNTLKTTFLNIKLQRLCKYHHLQCITSSKVWDKLEKSLCIRDKAEDLCCLSMVFGPSDDTHWHDSVIDITKWAQKYFKKPLSENTICIPSKRKLSFPVAQLVEHGASNAKIMGSFPRESKSWSNVNCYSVTWMHCKSLWIKVFC